jgi:hypothetical protein
MILITGKKHSGKSTLSKYISTNYPNTITYSLADKLKQITFELLRLFNINISSIDDLYNENKEKYRKYLQTIGTEIFQSNFGKDFWCEQVLNQIQELPNHYNIIIDDIRFQHEIDFFKKHFDNCKVIQIINERIVSNDIHPSETQNLHNIDYIIKNNSTKEDLYKSFDNLKLL